MAAALALLLGCAQHPVSALADVQPPPQPIISEDPGEDAPILHQPPALTAELLALTEGSIEERIAKLKRKVLKDLIRVEGGSFMMGDFGLGWTPEGLYYTSGIENKPPYKVTLTGYNLARFKTTYAEYDVFADATGRPRAGMERRPGHPLPPGFYRHPLIPAGMY
ncbi:hypothetical protein AB4Z27_28655, partial [Cupriavidus sp. KB_39]